VASSNFERPEYREIRQSDLSGGVNDYLNQNVIKPTETPDALNVDFDRASVDTAFGSIKFNNQTAPSACIRTKSLKGQQPLAVMSAPLQRKGVSPGPYTVDTRNIEVPMRGYGYLPYAVETDIGGNFAEGLTDAATTSLLSAQYHYHARRGRNFELNVSFRLPQHEKLFDVEVKGANAPAVPALPMIPPNGFDEALDETFIIIQKGGDRLAPMSWALGVTNIGNGYGLAQAPQPRPSNYALVFMWYDNAGWGNVDGQRAKYNLTSGQDLTGAATQNSTMAYRAVVIHRYIEPDVSYHVAVQLQLDTGTPATFNGVPGGTGTNVAGTWNANGFFRVHVTDSHGNFTSHVYNETPTAKSGLEVCRGPLDSLSYLTRYGIRYSGRDAMFLGLGMRFSPWDHAGFIPFGHDSACMRSGGMALTDRSSIDPNVVFGAPGVNGITADHTSGNSYLTLGQPNMATVQLVGSRDPMALADTTVANQYAEWTGLQYNFNALRGYRIVATSTVTSCQGARLTLLDRDASNANRINFLDGADTAKFGSFGNVGNQNFLVQCFRWSQRDLDIGNVKIWSAPRDYQGTASYLNVPPQQFQPDVARRRWSLSASLALEDKTEPDIASLIAYWPCDDSGGGVLHERVVGGLRHGFLCPMQNATSDAGQRGGNMLFMSGEGEALVLDLSENETFLAQLAAMLRQPDQGFGFEVSFVETEASYGVYTREAATRFTNDPLLLSNIFTRPVGGPELVQWDVKDPTAGRSSRPRRLLSLTHRPIFAENSNTPCEYAQGFGVEVASFEDSRDYDPAQPHALAPWYLPTGTSAMVSRYDKYAGWVGKRITVQVGVQSFDPATDSYNVYIAMTPKAVLKPTAGDPDDVEFSYWTDTEANSSGSTYAVGFLDGAQMRISKKDIERTVLTVGGSWDCKTNNAATKALGIHELSARMLVDEIRWFATTPAGALSPTTGTAITARNGKLQGTNCLPQRLLTDADLKGSLGTGASTVTVAQGSRSVTVTSTSLANGQAPAVSQQSVLGSYLYVDGDTRPLSVEETLFEPVKDFYYIDAVSANNAILTLANSYRAGSKTLAAASAFRVVGYTAFEEDVSAQRLYLGKGKGYDPASATIDDVVLTEGYWANRAITGGSWSLRIYNPFSIYTLEQASPDWTRGIVSERRHKDDGILGLHGYNDRIYAGVRGSLYEVDDRWRDEGPTDDLPASLLFRAAKLASDAVAPLHQDRVEFTTVAAANFGASPTDAYATVFDHWAKLNKIDEYQGVLWMGGVNLPVDQGAWRTLVSSTAANTTYTATSVFDSTPWVIPATVVPGVWIRVGTAYGQVTSVSGTTINVTGWVNNLGQAFTPAGGSQAEVFVPGHRTVYQTRYSRGKPQIAFGSSGQISPGVYPEKGLFIATAEIAVQVKEWHHVRWVVPSQNSGAWLQVPRCYINGKRVAVTVSASELGATGTQWISTANIVTPFGTQRVVLGALRDAYTVSDPPQLNFRKDLIVMSPARHVGWLHSLDGLLSQVITTRQPWTGTDYANFNPYAINYNAPGLIAQFNALSTDLGVGHKVRNDAGPVSGGGPIIYGTILSHPFISLWHAAGDYSNQWTFAENGAQVHATNGGNPVVVIDIDPDSTPVATQSGVPAPTTELDFTTTRFPLWRLETQAPTEQRDPLLAGKEVYGLSTIGNCYLEQSLGAAMPWVADGIFHFKLLFTPKDVAGRISLFRRGTDANNGGPFVECVDGKVRYGWYDLGLKKPVWIETDSAVIEPGKLTYIYIRHRYPKQDKLWGNWRNSYFANGHYRRFEGTLATTGQTLRAGQIVYGWTGAANVGQYQIVKAWQASTLSGAQVVIDAVRINDTQDNLNSTEDLYSAVSGGGTHLVNLTYAARPMHDMFVVQQFGNSRATWNGGALGTLESPTPHLPLEVIHAGGGFNWNQTTYGGRTASTLAEDRTYWSLTTDEYPIGSAGPSSVLNNWKFKATGMASVPWMQYTTVAASNEFVLETTAISGFGVFPWLQCIGAVFEILDDGSSGAIAGRQFIITEVEDNSAAPRLKRIVVTNLDGSAPSLPVLVTGYGAVFIGRTLVKSADFDNSVQVDATQKEIQLFGCQDSDTFQPFDGVVHSFGYGVALPNATTDKADTFESRNTSATNTTYATDTTEDGMFVGADAWSYPINSQPTTVGLGGANFPVNTLKFTAGLQYIQVNGSTYAAASTYVTTKPNTQLEVQNTSTVTSTGGVESRCKWRYLQAVSDWAGKRYVAVGFYDPTQGIAGNPGPVLEILPAGNDASNDAGPVAINLTNIPAGPDGSEVWIYCSPANGNAATLYRVARLVNGTNGYQISTPEAQIVTGPPAEFVNNPPPRCEIVASSKGSMIYAALEVQPDGVVPSRPASPGQVDFTKLFRLQGGTGDKITGAIEFDGLLVVTKRRMVASVEFVGGNYAVPDVVSNGVGCVSPNTLVAKDNVLLFLSDRGMQATTRRGVTNLNSPEYIGDNISTFVQDAVDRRYLGKAYAALNRKRSQYTCVVRTREEDHQNYRFTCDLTNEGPIYSLYRLPNLTAVAAARKRDGADEIVVGGTEEGFVVFLDRPDATQAVMGEITGIWGLPTVQNYLATTTNAMYVSYNQQVDTTLEAQRGVTASYRDVDGNTQEVNVLGYVAPWILFAEPLPATIPANVNVAMGQQDTHYETPWFDMGNAERRKLLCYINLVFGREQAGEVVVRVYTDWDQDNIRAESVLDLTNAEQEVSLGGVDGNWFKMTLDSVDQNPGLKFTLSSIIWRIDDTDQV
jgi:hypothetical protein